MANLPWCANGLPMAKCSTSVRVASLVLRVRDYCLSRNTTFCMFLGPSVIHFADTSSLNSHNFKMSGKLISDTRIRDIMERK